MVDRTRAWLMSRKDGKGGFQRNARALDTFGRAPDHITNAYIVWALTESSKDDDVVKELDAAFDKAKTSKDPYFVALVANALINRNRAKDAIELLSAVAKLQKDDGHLDAEQTSITGSGGRDLQIETTSLVLARLDEGTAARAVHQEHSACRQLGRQAARRLRWLRLDPVHHPRPEGPDRLRQGEQGHARGRSS